MDVRIVRSEDWQTDVAAMADAIDDDTALVSVTLLSNVNGHIEPIRELADIAHAQRRLSRESGSPTTAPGSVPGPPSLECAALGR